MKVLFKTIHGSRLYGLSHENSDYDWYTVVDGRTKISQKIHGDQDNTVVDFNTFVRHAQAGAPQALEAMFSTKAEVDEIADFRAAFRAGTDYKAFKGIMKRISLTPKWNDAKHRRLVIRLGLELGELRMKNRFHPTLTMVEAESVDYIANLYDMEKSYDFAMRLAGYRESVLDCY